MITRLNTAVFWVGMALSAAGCASKTELGSTVQAPAQAGAAVEPEIPELSPTVVHHDGWEELNIDANSAKNSVGAFGHYHTDKNDLCSQPGEGAYDVANWNALAASLNQAVLTADLTTPRCWDSPPGSKFYNTGLAVLVLTNGTKRKIFEYKNEQICTTLSDAALADKLMLEIEMAVRLTSVADIEACPNYRPPGTF